MLSLPEFLFIELYEYLTKLNISILNAYLVLWTWSTDPAWLLLIASNMKVNKRGWVSNETMTTVYTRKYDFSEMELQIRVWKRIVKCYSSLKTSVTFLVTWLWQRDFCPYISASLDCQRLSLKVNEVTNHGTGIHTIYINRITHFHHNISVVFEPLTHTAMLFYFGSANL